MTRKFQHVADLPCTPEELDLIQALGYDYELFARLKRALPGGVVSMDYHLSEVERLEEEVAENKRYEGEASDLEDKVREKENDLDRVNNVLQTLKEELHLSARQMEAWNREVEDIRDINELDFWTKFTNTEIEHQKQKETKK
jgi:hypothetical protein